MVQKTKQNIKNRDNKITEKILDAYNRNISKNEIRRRLELSNQQVLAYSRDFVHIYRQEKDKRQKLEELHQTLKAIVNSMSDAMVATDNLFKIFEFNQAFLDIFPSIRKAENISATQFLPVDVIKKHIAVMKKEKRSSISFEASVTKRSGLVFWVTISKFVNSFSQNNGYVFLFRDITEKKRFEKAKNQFVLLASREVQVPLNGLLGLIDLLYDNVSSRLNDDEISHINFLINSGKNLQQMIEKMMQISPLQGNDEISKKLVHLDELVIEVLKAKQQDVKDQDIQIQYAVQSKGAILIDRDLVLKALCSIYKVLLTNTKPNGTIEIELGQFRKNMELSFKCLNISKKNRTNLQNMLNSQENFKDSISNSGISLALSREIIEWNDGKIKISDKNYLLLKIIFPSWIQAFNIQSN